MTYKDLRTRLQTGQGERFDATSWTLISAAKEEDSSRAREAMNQLCQAYWYPLYAFVRHRGHSPQDAQDLTQGFFSHLLEQQFLSLVDRRKGRFRSFLLVAIKHFLENERKYRLAVKRGSGKPIVSLSEETAEGRYAEMPPCQLPSEVVFDREWARTILERVRNRLELDYRTKGRRALFQQLKAYLVRETRLGDYQALAGELGVSPNAVAVEVHRLRKHFSTLVRAEIAQTVASPADLEGELRHFLSILAES